MIYKSENKLLDTFGASIKCFLCGEKIKDGESVINLTNSSNKSPKVICEECFYGRCY
jgi:hypothetical protein